MLVFEQATDGGLIALPFSEAEPEIQRVMDEDYLIHSDLTQYLYWDLPKKTGVSLYEVLASDAALFGVARVERQSESPRNESYALLCTTSITQTLYRIERAAITGIEQKIVTALGEMVQNLRGLVSVDFPDLTPNDKIYYVENP